MFDLVMLIGLPEEKKNKKRKERLIGFSKILTPLQPAKQNNMFLLLDKQSLYISAHLTLHAGVIFYYDTV